MKKIIFFLLLFLLSVSGVNSQDTLTKEYKISALRINNNSLKLDGILNEEEWSKAEAITELIQCEPSFGVPVSERTEVRILYDEDNVYVGAVCYYKDMNDLVADKLAHRDIGWDDQFFFIFDTFHDKIKGYCFGAPFLEITSLELPLL